MPEKFTIDLDARELATVIAALRYWAEDGWDACVDMASIGKTVAPLSTVERLDLAERINAASAPKATA